jgi:phage/plasmid-like protein (TIGR03299 family)
MAHLLDQTTGKTAFAFNALEGNPWHGLGQSVPGAMTAAQALELGGLDYMINQVRNTFTPETYDLGGITVQPEPREALSWTTYREDTGMALGSVGDRYEIVQNADAFAFFDAIVDRGEAIYQTAGAVREGRQVFLTAKLPARFALEDRPDELIEQYILLTNTHDGTGALTVQFTPIRVVCNNTLQHALKMEGHGKVKLRHTTNVLTALAHAHRLLQIVNKHTEEMRQGWEAMMRHPFTTNDRVKLTQTLFPMDRDNTRTKNLREAFTQYFESGPGQAQHTGNRWGAYNAVTGFLSRSQYKDASTRFDSIQNGSSAAKMREAFAMLG